MGSLLDPFNSDECNLMVSQSIQPLLSHSFQLLAILQKYLWINVSFQIGVLSALHGRATTSPAPCPCMSRESVFSPTLCLHPRLFLTPILSTSKWVAQTTIWVPLVQSYYNRSYIIATVSQSYAFGVHHWLDLCLEIHARGTSCLETTRSALGDPRP